MYYVRIGGGTVEVENTDGTKSNVAGYIYDTFTFAVDAGGEDEKPKVLIGDADGSGSVLALDTTEIFKYLAKMSSSALNTSDENWYAAAYSTGDNSVLALDTTEIFKYLAKMSVEFVGTEVEIGTYGDKAN